MLTNNSTLIIRLPENKKLTGRLVKISVIISIFIGIASVISLVGYLTNLSPFQNIFIGSIGISFTLVAFIFAVINLLLEGEIESSKDKSNSKYIHIFYIFTSLSISILITGIGLLFLSDYFSKNKSSVYVLLDGNNYTKETLLTSGICIFLIGIAFISARIKIKYHFHVVHLLALIVLMISSLNILDNIYQALSPFRLQFTYLPINIAIIFMFLSIAIGFRWPSKGFIGIFTTEAVSTIFTLRILFINIILIALLGLISLGGAKAGLYFSFESIAVFAILIMLSATILSWLNIKLLYKFESERFIMREELKSHNIHLKLGNEELTNKMGELKKTNEEYSRKLSYRERLFDVIEKSE